MQNGRRATLPHPMSDTHPEFVPGLELSRGFFLDEVEPILRAQASDLVFSAALIGPGSEVLGYDDDTSTDHHWGPRLLVFMSEADASSRGPRLRETLAAHLPRRYRGYPTSFTPPDPSDNGTQLLEFSASGPINHRVELVGIRGWLRDYLGIESLDLDQPDWLSLPQQKLLSIVSGEVFHDQLPPQALPPGVVGRSPREGALAVLRRRLAWYPVDVERYLIASVWQRISQEEHLVGRAAQAGDELGARIIAARLVRDCMRFCFLAERTYAPYPKWFGHAFAALDSADRMGPLLVAVSAATDWRVRDAALAAAYAELARIHNELGITAAMPVEPHGFFGRPFTVLAIEGFAAATLASIQGDWPGRTLRRSPIGNIDLVTDNTDLLEDPAFRPAVAALFRT